MSMAHILYKAFPIRPLGNAGPEFKTWKDALIYAWYFERFRKTLRTGIIHFTYYKKDGSYREATGTTFPWLIPAENQPKTKDQATNDKRPTPADIIYYDIDAKGWRMFDIRRFIGFVSVYRITRVEGKALRDLKEVKIKYI